MARFNGMITKELLTAGVEKYTGRKVTDLKRHDDPEVAGAIALRATLEGDEGEMLDFLISAHAPALTTADAVMDALEECEYKQWPPAQGKPRFY